MAKQRPSKLKNPDVSFPEQIIKPVDLEKEMRKSYIAYAMSVIVGRALPDVRDGLKPVHRRILYTMYEDGLTSDKTFRKSATTVGDVLGRYHPHGDTSVYDAMVRLAQDFSLRYPLIEGHGNFGSLDSHRAAAYRYTEARLARLSNEMVREIDKETVDFILNFDDSRQEPHVLPSRFPNLLVNGSSGIAVGMATNIPPHNLSEVIDAVICVMRDPEATLEDLMEHIKGPDFPTGGVIVGRSGIRSAYTTGRGLLKLRSKTEIIEGENGKMEIDISDIPYQVIKPNLLKEIDEKIKDKTIDGATGWRDETDRDGFRIVVELRRDANPQVALNQLFANTQMQVTFGVTLLALVNRAAQPKILTLREILDEYITFQLEVIVRRTVYDLRKARERAHILEGLRIAVDNIDEVIRIIRSSYSDAKEKLMERFGLSDVQTQAILELQLRRLQGLEREKVEQEYRQLMEKIEYYQTVLASEEKQKEILIEELTEIKTKFGDERRTDIQIVEDELDVEDLIEEEDCVFTLTRAGYIKRVTADTYRAQNRGGKGIMAMTTRDEDYVETVFTASTHDYLLFFTNFGRVFRKKGYQIPEAGRTAKGSNIVNIIQSEPDEKVTAMLHFREISDDEMYLFMVTRNGTVKRLKVTELKNIRNVGIRALSLDEGDELIGVLETDGNCNILIATKFGMAICFNEKDVRAMGRTAVGVMGIRLAKGDICVGAAKLREGGSVLTVTENGYGKRTEASEYIRGDGEPQRRGGKGLRNGRLNDKTGSVADVKVVDGDEDILLITDEGTIIRMASSDISLQGRATQGVRLMRVPEGVRVISVARTAAAEDEPETDDINMEVEIEITEDEEEE
ncbi:MAG: DNA gyrase subunit A [Oscillospiraceae bacterium]|jgi:DNA gyrase subunit A|nr:DNA gyrase subunit A [Oscillospiraceae bacterium]